MTGSTSSFVSWSNPEPASGLKPKTLLLGLGNDILCDDAIGLRVATAAGDLLKDREHIAVALSSEMGLALLDEITGFENLMVVDAVETKNGAPGTVYELDLEDLSTLPSLSPHFLGIGEVIALGRKLGLSVPTRVKIVAVEVQDAVTVSTTMTPPLEAAVPALAQKVLDLLYSTS